MSALSDLVIDCENRLGLPMTLPTWKSRSVEIAKLKRALKRQPDISVEDLRVALAYCARRRQAISSTLDLIMVVDKAKEHQVVNERTSDLTIAWQDAITWEHAYPDDQTGFWVRRLTRSVGPSRAETLAEWRAAGRGSTAA